MKRLSIANLGAVFFAGLPLAHSQEIVTTVSVDEVISAFSAVGLMDVSDQTVDPDVPTIGAVRDDLFTVQATLHDCADGRCSGLALTAPVPVREMLFATNIEGSIDAGAAGFDARVQNDPLVTIIETYLVYDGGVSEELLPATLSALNFVIDQAKQIMLQDDPGAAEAWPQAASDG